MANILSYLKSPIINPDALIFKDINCYYSAYYSIIVDIENLRLY